MTKDIHVIFCPPKNAYHNPPRDISKCKEIECPICHEKMWFSEKKTAYKMMVEKLNKEIFFGCYDCFMDFVQKMKENNELDLHEFIQINI